MPYMRKTPEPPDHVPAAPSPSAANAAEGMENTRAMARRYLPDAIRLLAGVAFAPDSEAALYTRVLCAKEIVAIAGAIPQAAPAPPPYPPFAGASDSNEPD